MENDEIEQFLIWDFIDFLDKYESPDYWNYYVKNVHRIAQTHFKYRHYIRFVDLVYNRILYPFISLNRKYASPKILWYSTKDSYIFYNLKKEYCDIELISSGIKDQFSAIKHLIKYNDLTDMFGFINDYMSTKDINHLTKMLGIIENKLKTIKPDYVVLQGDSLPVERAIILACRDLGITTINIQDGICHYQLGPAHGQAADYTFVWGQYFKDMFVNQGIKTSDKVYVLGYTHKLEKNIDLDKQSDYIVYYLGENYEIYDNAILDVKLNTINRINELCLKYGIQFYYRPHPADNRKILLEFLPNINISPIEETLEQSFNKGNIFIGFSSTTLPEASMRNRISIQLKNYPKSCDNLEELGGCSKTVKTLDDLENHLLTIINCKGFGVKHQFNNNYMDTTKNPSESFLSILNEIENIKNQIFKD